MEHRALEQQQLHSGGDTLFSLKTFPQYHPLATAQGHQPGCHGEAFPVVEGLGIPPQLLPVACEFIRAEAPGIGARSPRSGEGIP